MNPYHIDDEEDQAEGMAAEAREGAEEEAEEMELRELQEIVYEIEQQPAWRANADKEMDYVDGNQLDSELLRRQQALGIPPAVENIIGPIAQSVMGMEAKTRRDWRISPDGTDGQGDEVAEALNFKLNQAERHSKADRACSEAFRPQYCVGAGFVEVARERDPTKFKYRATAVPRNECWWDMMTSKEPDLSDARWFVRQKWLHKRRVIQSFPQHKELINACANGSGYLDILMDGAASTGLNNAWATARGSSIEEQFWLDKANGMVRLLEVWYRRWVQVPVIMSSDGRVVEFDEANPAHMYAAATGTAKITIAPMTRVRRSYWLGPHKLSDEPSPYPHKWFPYAPFWGWKEDRTGVPYGAVRGMIFPQDNLNSSISKLRWGMSSVRTERTKGAVDMTDEQFRQQIARVDADVVLNAAHMAQPGARFEVKRDFQLNEQQYRLMDDSRNSIMRTGGITNGFMGQNGSATSGLQEQTQVEQSTQALADIMDNFEAGRTLVGEMLLAMIIEDMGSSHEVIHIPATPIKPAKTIALNVPSVDPDTEIPYLSNDVQRTRLKVALEDVPTSSSFRAQQLSALSEAVKSLPPNIQTAALPFLVELMDVPHKKDIIQALRVAADQGGPEEVQRQIDQAVADALAKSNHDLKARELELRAEKQTAEIREIIARTVQTGVQAAFSAMQAGAQVATMPQIAPIADAVMQSAGYQPPNPGGADPNFPTPANGVPVAPTGTAHSTASGVPMASVRQNTSPEFPPVPQKGPSPQTGIETPTPADNLAGVSQ